MHKSKEIGIKTVLIYSLLVNSGSTSILPLTTKYMHDYLGKTLIDSGFVLLLMAIFIMIGNYAGGFLFDCWSAYKTSLISGGISTVASIALIFFHSWPWFAILLMIFGLGNGANLTLVNSYASLIQSKNSRYIFNTIYIGLNIGVVLGTLIVGYFYQFGITTVFTSITALYLVALIMTIFLFNIDFSDYQESIGQVKKTKHIMNPNLLLVVFICLMTLSAYLIYAIWESVISVRMGDMGISFEKYSYIWVINGLMIIIGQSFVNKITQRIMRLNHQVLIGLALFGLSFLGLLWAQTYTEFIIVMIITTIGEMIGLPGIPAWINNLATPKQRGQYQGFFNIAMSLGRASGPLYAGIMVEKFNYPILFIFSVILVMATLGLTTFRNYQQHDQVLKK